MSLDHISSIVTIDEDPSLIYRDINSNVRAWGYHIGQVKEIDIPYEQPIYQFHGV